MSSTESWMILVSTIQANCFASKASNSQDRQIYFKIFKCQQLNPASRKPSEEHPQKSHTMQINSKLEEMLSQSICSSFTKENQPKFFKQEVVMH